MVWLLKNLNYMKRYGGLKTNMKLTFTYEFLLRMSYKSSTNNGNT